MAAKDSGWNEWSKFVLKELERLNTNTEKLSVKVDSLHIASSCPFNSDIKEMKEQIATTDAIIRTLQIQFAKWTGAAIVIFTLLQWILHITGIL